MHWEHFQSLWFYDVPRVLIADARSFQGLASILDRLTHLASTHAGIDPMPDKMNLDHLNLFYCEFHKDEVLTMSVVGGQPKRHANPSYKAAKNMEHPFLISDYYWSIISMDWRGRQ